LKKNIIVLIILVLCLSLSSVKADNLGTLQLNAFPMRMSGSTQTKDGTVFALNPNYTTNTVNVYKSSDQGSTWTYVSTLPGSQPTYIEEMYCTSNDTLLAVDGYQGIQGYIYRSTDYGKTWTTPYTFLDINETAWGFFEDTNGQIYAPVYSSGSTQGLHDRLLRSTDDGATWQTIAYWGTNYRHCHGIYVNPYNGYIYQALGDGPLLALMRSKDNGTTWTNLDTKHLWSAITSQGNSNTIYLGEDDTNSSLWKFTDDGSTNFNPTIVYNFGNNSGGYFWWFQNVSGKLVFGTETENINDTPYLAVSDNTWTSITMVTEQTATAAWQGFYPATSSYWNISKIYISDTVEYPRIGASYQPPASAPVQPLSAQFTGNNGARLFSLYTTQTPILLNVTITGGTVPYNITLFYNNQPIATTSTNGNLSYSWTAPNEWQGSKFTAIITAQVIDYAGKQVWATPYLVVDPPTTSTDTNYILPAILIGIAAATAIQIQISRRKKTLASSTSTTAKK
jgi:hypothetical protein